MEVSITAPFKPTWIVLALMALAGGCASSPPIGHWFGPSTPAPVTIEPLPNLDPSERLVITPHYNIYTTLEDDDLLNRIAQLMEGSIQAYQTLAPSVPLTRRRMDCYIFQKRSQWAEFTREHSPQPDVYLKINRGGYTIGDWYVAYYIGEGSTISVAAHEGWHQYVFRNYKGRLAPFLDEALATMFEGVQFENGLPQYNVSINETRVIALRYAVDNDNLWPLEDLLAMHAGMVVDKTGPKIDAFYAQAWAFGRFLWDGDGGKYRPALRRLLTDTANGTVYDPTGSFRSRARPWNPQGFKPMLEHYMGMNFEQIDAAYGRFVRKVAYKELLIVNDQPD